MIAIDNPIHLDQVRKRGVNTLLVSKGFTQADADALGFELCSDFDEAMNKANAKQGVDSTIGIIPYCGETLVRIRKDDR